MKKAFLVFTALVFLLATCTTSQSESTRAEGSVADELDRAIREASDYLNKNVPVRNKLVILNIKSDYPPLSEYIIDVLTENVVNDRVFTVVDRANLMLIRQEMDFQLSGEVSDESAQSIGQKLGAQTIVSGSITAFGNLWRLTIRALDVEGATIQGMFNRNMSNGASIAALTSNGPVPVAPVIAATGGKQQAVREPDLIPAPEPLKPVVYKIGDIGPAGGFIFYDKGNSSNGWRYLEAAPADTEITAPWIPLGRGRFLNGDNSAVGKGLSNTTVIVAHYANQGGGFGSAAWECNDLVINGFDDWFLPSLDELSYMYGNLHRKGLGGFANSMYWSSSTGSDGGLAFSAYAQGVNFQDGSHQRGGVDNTNHVRAIRQF
jgi:TolB-like protein